MTKRNGDGEIVWGPDAELTPLGEKQALVSICFPLKLIASIVLIRFVSPADGPRRLETQPRLGRAYARGLVL